LIVWLPEVALLPAQPPEAVQDVAFVEDQVSVDDPPLATDVGFAEIDMVGAGSNTVTVADALCDPPDPVQVRLKVLLLVSAPEPSLPEVALAPDQPPEAVQDVAFVEDQLSVAVPPLATELGLAVSDTVGTGVCTAVAPPLVSTGAGQPASARASTETNSRVPMRGISKLIDGSGQRSLRA
jgi:hypothetical protein